MYSRYQLIYLMYTHVCLQKKQLLNNQDCYLSLYQRRCKDAKWENEIYRNQEVTVEVADF